MKTVIYIVVFCLIAHSCSKDDNSLNFVELEKPSAMIVFCQSRPVDTLKRVVYDYENDYITSESIFSSGERRSKTTYEYDSNNNLVLQIYERNGQIESEMTFLYNEHNQLINIFYKFTFYDNDGQIISESEFEAPREYENNLLVKEWEYWGGFNTYEYENGKVVIKIDYNKNGDKHHITKYKYWGELLTEERKETVAGNVIYIKTLNYDSENRLTSVVVGERVIEENFYIENRLIEKRTYKWESGAIADICDENYLYKYVY